MSDTISFPGDKIASIEEYESGSNTFDDGNMVRAAVIGTTEIDKKDRIASIKNQKFPPIPKVGDIVIGTVSAVMSSMVAVAINYINGKPTSSNLECICSTRNNRKRTIALVKDVMALKIIGKLNGTIHAGIGEPELGVLFTKCKKCGGHVIQMRDAIKCKDCAWIDERKLSQNFGNSDFLKLSE